jgi:hypothetical protein
MCKLSDMGTPKIIAFSNRDESNARVTTWHSNATEKKKDLVMSNVTSVVEIILQVQWMYSLQRPMKKKKHTHLSGWNSTLIPHTSKITYKLNQE